MPNFLKIQKEKAEAADALYDVNMYLTATDRREAALKMGCDEDTVRKYVSGEEGRIKKLPFALKLLAVLREIKARRAEIANTAKQLGEVMHIEPSKP